jgi:hypothetical protein
VGIVWGVPVTIVAGDWIAVGVTVAAPIAGGEVGGAALQLVSHKEDVTNKETTFSAIVTNVKPVPVLTKTQACFLRDHGYRWPSLPILL